MRDLIILIFLLGCIFAAAYRAWFGVLSLAVFSYMNPHAYAWGFVRTLPAYQILFIVVGISTLVTKDKQRIPNDWRIPAFFFLWFYFFITTTQAYAQEIAWAKLWFISKIYLPFIFTLILINTKEKLFYLICTIAASIGILAVKGGIFSLLSGFNSRVYGPPATILEENNAFAVAVLITVPLVLLCQQQITNKMVRLTILGVTPLFFACSLASWSRGALLTLIALSLVVFWHSRHKFLLLPLGLIGVYAVLNYLPDEWIARMYTLKTYQDDGSAMGRIDAWRDGWYHTLKHPFTGAGFDGYLYVTERDWHNSFVEMLAEHGFIAFGVWISLIIGTVISLTILPWRMRDVPGAGWVKNYCYMLRASIFAYMVGTSFLGLSYWDLLYHLIFISVLVKKFALEDLAQYRATRLVEKDWTKKLSNTPENRPVST